MDALIDPGVRTLDRPAPSKGDFPDAGFLVSQLSTLVVPRGATREEATSMNAERAIIRTAAQENVSQAEMRAAAGALERLVALHDQFAQRLTQESQSIAMAADEEYGKADDDVRDEANEELKPVREGLKKAVEGVKTSLSGTPDHDKIDTARSALKTLQAAVVEADKLAESAREQRRKQGADLRGQLPEIPKDALPQEQSDLDEVRKKIAAAIPDLPTAAEIAKAPELIAAFGKRVQVVHAAIEDRNRRIKKAGELKQVLSGIEADKRISQDEDIALKKSRSQIGSMLPEVPSDTQLGEAEKAIETFRIEVAALQTKVAEREKRIKEAQGILDGLTWGADPWLPHTEAPEDRLKPIREALAQLSVTLMPVTQWPRAHEFDDGTVTKLKEDVAQRRVELDTLNKEVQAAFSEFETLVETAGQKIDGAGLSATQKKAFGQKLDVAKTSGEGGLSGLTARTKAVEGVVTDAEYLARAIAPLIRRLKAVKLKPDGALDTELKALKELHDKIEKGLDAVTET